MFIIFISTLFYVIVVFITFEGHKFVSFAVYLHVYPHEIKLSINQSISQSVYLLQLKSLKSGTFLHRRPLEYTWVRNLSNIDQNFKNAKISTMRLQGCLYEGKPGFPAGIPQ